MNLLIAISTTAFLLPLAVDGYALFPLPMGQLIKWPQNLLDVKKPKVQIPYTFAPGDITPAEEMSFQAATKIIEEGTGTNCIKFQRRDYNPVPQWLSLYGFNGPIQTIYLKNEENQNQLDICRTFGGMLNTAAGQIMFVGNNSDPQRGCLRRAKGDRETVRILMNLLGIANEFQRFDRDNFIDVNPLSDSLIIEAAKPFFKKDSSLKFDPNGFDFESATMVTPTRFSKSNQNSIFTLKDTTKKVPIIPYLSSGDCQTISYLYGCGLTTTKCADLNPPIEMPNFALAYPRREYPRAANCWPKSTTLSPVKDIGLIPSPSITLGTVAHVEIDGPDTDYLTLSTDISPPTTLQLTQGITADTKLEFLLSLKDNSNKVLTRGTMTIDLRCRPIPTKVSDILYTTSPTGETPFALTPPPFGEIGGAAQASPLSTGPVNAHAKFCTGTVIKSGYVFTPFPMDPNILISRLAVTPSGGGAAGDWTISPPTGGVIQSTTDITTSPTLTYQFVFFYYDSRIGGASQLITIGPVTFDCDRASEPLRHAGSQSI